MNRFLKSRKTRLLLALISLLFLVNLMQESYAKYISSAAANGNFTIARWAFIVNNQDVLANNNFSSTISPTFDTNANIKANVIAPTSTGHFEVQIDSSDVDVAFDEIITLTQATDNTVSDLKFTGYSINNGAVIPLSGNSPTITVNHDLNELVTTNTYCFYIEWYDGVDETMDNADDADASYEGVAQVNVNLQFIQRALQSNVTPEPDPEPEP